MRGSLSTIHDNGNSEMDAPLSSAMGYKHEAAKARIYGYITDLRNVK
jgi:hypothetical protein